MSFPCAADSSPYSLPYFWPSPLCGREGRRGTSSFLKRKSDEVIFEVRRLLAKELGSDEEEEAMAVISVVEQLKEDRRSWEEA